MFCKGQMIIARRRLYLFFFLHLCSYHCCYVDVVIIIIFLVVVDIIIIIILVVAWNRVFAITKLNTGKYIFNNVVKNTLRISFQAFSRCTQNRLHNEIRTQMQILGRLEKLTNVPYNRTRIFNWKFKKCRTFIEVYLWKPQTVYEDF